MMGTTLRVALSDEHDVVVVGSGPAARELLGRDREFHAIVCDLMMPKLSGMELHDWLRAESPELARRMIFMTGGAYTPGAFNFLDKVENPHIQKPFDLDELLSLVRRTRAAA
jgi:DNA-binding NtrC family response regulator